MLEHRLSALLQLHLHSRLNTWLEWMSKDKCKTRLETFKFCDLVRLILEGKCNIYPFLNFLFSRIDVKIVDLNNLGYLKPYNRAIFLDFVQILVGVTCNNPLYPELLCGDKLINCYNPSTLLRFTIKHGKNIPKFPNINIVVAQQHQSQKPHFKTDVKSTRLS